MMRPEIAYKEQLYLVQATGNESAKALLPPAITNNPVTYPPEEVLERLEFSMPLGPEGDAKQAAIWKEIKDG
jgi:spermidine/putrescine transport system substrate-binding protein